MNPTDAMPAAWRPVRRHLAVVAVPAGAHFVVKFVMLGLLARLGVVLGDHHRQDAAVLAHPQGRWTAFEEVFWSGQSLEELYRMLTDRPTSSMAAVFVAAMREWKRSFEGSGRRRRGPARQRIDKVLDVTIQREVERLEFEAPRASPRSARPAPFIGLFGTVWGIMTSFTLDRGLEEHLARGRRARHRRGAVRHRHRPVRRDSRAVIAYNKLQAEAAKQQARLEGFADEFSAILSRQIDERHRRPEAG